MGTRGVIAEKYGQSWRGRYHHWDSYPTGLGKSLWHVIPGVFGGNVELALDFLLRKHSAWSTINGADWTKPPGYTEDQKCRKCGGEYSFDHEKTAGHKFEYPKASDFGPKCYCHGSRNEKGETYLRPEDDAGAEWAYVLDKKEETLTVLRHIWKKEGTQYVGIGGLSASEPLSWEECGTFKLDGPEPDWSRVECGQNLERCSHYKWFHDKTICTQCDGKKYEYFGGHSVGSTGGCSATCVPVEKLQEPLKSVYLADPSTQKKNWHVSDPHVCKKCKGTGKAKVDE